jgi:nicotinamidase-related amidase
MKMKSALLVIDAQRIYTNPKSELFCKNPDKTLAEINRLIGAFHKRAFPIIFVRHVHKANGSDLGRMFDFSGDFEDFNFKSGSDEVNFDSRLDRPARAQQLIKNRYSAFAGTKLDRILKKLKVDRVVICGFMTNFCCDSTAREAHDKDYYVDFVVDATGTPGLDSMDQKDIRRAVSEMLAAGYACVYSTKQFLKKLRKR